MPFSFYWIPQIICLTSDTKPYSSQTKLAVFFHPVSGWISANTVPQNKVLHYILIWLPWLRVFNPLKTPITGTCLPLQLHLNGSKSLLLQCYLIFMSYSVCIYKWDVLFDQRRQDEDMVTICWWQHEILGHSTWNFSETWPGWLAGRTQQQIMC